MEQTYTFRKGQESDIEEISNLVEQVFGVKRNRQYWEWKYYRNPAGRGLSALTLHNERVVGHMGGIPVRFSFAGREAIGVQEVDFSMLEQHRRYDLFLKMGRLGAETCSKENFDFGYGFSTEVTSEIAQALKLKKRIGPIPRLVKVLDMEPFIRQRVPVNVVSRTLSAAANTALRMRYTSRMEIPEGIQIRQLDRFDERFDYFWDRIKKDYPIMAIRDSAYLNWRYPDAPHQNYEIFCLEQTRSMEILGFIVLGVRQLDFLIGQIFDIITPRSEDRKATRYLLGHAINRFLEKKAAMATCWMFPHSHIYFELIKMGFISRQDEGRDLLFQNLGLQDPVIPDYFGANPGNWYISMGDSDMD